MTTGPRPAADLAAPGRLPGPRTSFVGPGGRARPGATAVRSQRVADVDRTRWLRQTRPPIALATCGLRNRHGRWACMHDGQAGLYHRAGRRTPLFRTLSGGVWTMRIAVVGAGPTGLFTGMVLARRGHEVTVVDRDSGPRPDGSWSRRGVMQFHHPHAFRTQVVEALQAELPDVWRSLLAAGAEPITMPADPT